MLAAALKHRGESSRKTVDLQTAALLRESIQTVRSDLSSKITSADQGRLMVEELARELATAQSAGQQLAARDLAERLRTEVDSVTRSTFDLAQELLATQTNILIGTGRLQGIDAIEEHLAGELSAVITTVKDVDEAMASVLNGREDASALLGRLGSLRAQIREQGAGLITEARRAGEHLDELHRQERIDMGRVGDPTRSNSSIRKLIDDIGTSAFPVEERRGAQQRRRG
jgi:DNA repair ATPase RecN